MCRQAYRTGGNAVPKTGSNQVSTTGEYGLKNVFWKLIGFNQVSTAKKRYSLAYSLDVLVTLLECRAPNE
jgi:hypothetical protein